MKPTPVSPCPQPSPSVAPSPSAGTSIIPSNPSAQPTSSNCQPNAIQENPCRPWVGAAANGNPGIPGSAVAKDKISQFDYLEKLVGRPLDIFRDYDGGANPPLNSNESHFAQRPNTYIDINWKPDTNWAIASGSDPAVNANIDKAAASIKTVAPHKVFLTIWHEPQNDVSAFDNTAEQALCKNDPNFKGLVGHAGTPGQYKAMWQNVENRFRTDGVTNVVWVMNYMSYAPFDCMVPMLWPGNNLVDWVIYDTYSRGKTWDQTAGIFYHVLEQNNSATVNFESKPWGVGEFGTCKQPATGISASQYFSSIKSAIDTNTYPRLKMYLVYADTGNNSGPGCLTDYDANGTYDPQKQTVFNQLFNDQNLVK